VVRNKVNNARWANKEANGTGIGTNFADKVEVVFDMLKTDDYDFVLRIFAQKHTAPSWHCIQTGS